MNARENRIRLRMGCGEPLSASVREAPVAVGQPAPGRPSSKPRARSERHNR